MHGEFNMENFLFTILLTISTNECFLMSHDEEMHLFFHIMGEMHRESPMGHSIYPFNISSFICLFTFKL